MQRRSRPKFARAHPDAGQTEPGVARAELSLDRSEPSFGRAEPCIGQVELTYARIEPSLGRNELGLCGSDPSGRRSQRRLRPTAKSWSIQAQFWRNRAQPTSALQSWPPSAHEKCRSAWATRCGLRASRASGRRCWSSLRPVSSQTPWARSRAWSPACPRPRCCSFRHGRGYLRGVRRLRVREKAKEDNMPRGYGRRRVVLEQSRSVCPEIGAAENMFKHCSIILCRCISAVPTSWASVALLRSKCRADYS